MRFSLTEAKKAQERLIEASLSDSNTPSSKDEQIGGGGDCPESAENKDVLKEMSDAVTAENVKKEIEEGVEEDNEMIKSETEKSSNMSEGGRKSEEEVEVVEGGETIKDDTGVKEDNNAALRHTNCESETAMVSQNTAETNTESQKDTSTKQQDSVSAIDTKVKNVIKEIKSIDVSPIKVGNLLANLNDPELSKKCSELAEEIRIIADPVHKLSFRE